MKTKNTFATLVMSCLSVMAMAQEVPTPPEPPQAPAEPMPPVEIQESGDTTRMNFGNIQMIIIEKEKKEDKENNKDNNDKEGDKKDREVTFDSDDFSHWSGIGFGVNGFMTFDNKLTLPAENKFLELDYSRSITVNFNFAEKTLPIVKNYVGITTGLGIQWNRYGIKNNYDIKYNSDSIYGVFNPTINYTKNVLKATYIQIPLLLEFNTSKNADKNFHISAGVVGGYKLGSRLKTKWEADGQEYKNKVKGHYQFFPFQAYATAMVGYGDVSLYVNYGLTRVFEKGKGPQLYPVTAGIMLNF